MELHPQLEVLRPLIGTWQGPGHGEYPTIDAFDYTEQLVFEATDKPFLFYRQYTWSPEGMAMHTETGFLRAPDETTAEMMLAQPTGQTELAEGRVAATETGFDILLSSEVVNAATAKIVETTRRGYYLAADELITTFAMAAVGVPLTHHLQ